MLLTERNVALGCAFSLLAVSLSTSLKAIFLISSLDKFEISFGNTFSISAFSASVTSDFLYKSLATVSTTWVLSVSDGWAFELLLAFVSSTAGVSSVAALFVSSAAGASSVSTLFVSSAFGAFSVAALLVSSVFGASSVALSVSSAFGASSVAALLVSSTFGASSVAALLVSSTAGASSFVALSVSSVFGASSVALSVSSAAGASSFVDASLVASLLGASSFVGASLVASLLGASSFVGASLVASLLGTSSFVGASLVASLLGASSFVGASLALLSATFSVVFDFWCSSAACASFPIPNNRVDPTNIDAVPTVNLLIEYLFNLLGKKSNFFFNKNTPFLNLYRILNPTL